MKQLLFLLFYTIGQYAHAQIIRGIVTSDNQRKIDSALIIDSRYGQKTVSKQNGQWEIQLPNDSSHILYISKPGFLTETILIEKSFPVDSMIEVQLKVKSIQLSNFTISSYKIARPSHEYLSFQSDISSKLLEYSQSNTLSDGIRFAPGIRIENNCQNCGFTQLRMNGLEGAYTQLLINNRALFSSLASVYGLDMIPASMIDRVEVIRGGNSALFGGNAIAGTVNIITKLPSRNSYEINSSSTFVAKGSWDHTLMADAAFVSKNKKSGIHAYSYLRHRNPWDANGDQITEITTLNNRTHGIDIYQTAKNHKINATLLWLNEFRRGGADLDRLPHQSRLAEQLRHDILSAQAVAKIDGKKNNHYKELFVGAQHVLRNSYYGSGGRIIPPGDTLSIKDSLALNAYGRTEDISVHTGVRFHFQYHTKLAATLNTEWQLNKVQDRMPGYQRSIHQMVSTIGQNIHIEYKPNEKYSFQLTQRLDRYSLSGNYSFPLHSFPIMLQRLIYIPRFAIGYRFHEHWQFKTSIAKGYRGPQAFSEDLHIETLGGAPRFVLISPELILERSLSANASLSFEPAATATVNHRLVMDAFYTSLSNPFILSNAIELANGLSVITKRNGIGAIVAGTNLEYQFSYKRLFQIQSGITLQQARYRQPELLWESTDTVKTSIFTSQILRTPRIYGFVSAVYTPSPFWTLTSQAVLTGTMKMSKIVNIHTEQIELTRTPYFWDQGVKLERMFLIQHQQKLYLYAGMHNLFNSFQRDIPTGIERDASYIYGPLRPRSVYIGIKLKS